MKHCLMLLSIIISMYVFADNEYRPRFEISSNINQQILFKVKSESRYSVNPMEHYLTSFDFGAEFSVAQYLTLSIYYKHINQSRDSIWTVECRPIASAILKGRWNIVSMSNESKAEFRFRDSISYRYVNRTQLKLPPFSPLNIVIYSGDEIAAYISSEGLCRNCIFIGFDINIIKGLKGGLCYVFESSKSNTLWSSVHVIQSNIKYSF